MGHNLRITNKKIKRHLIRLIFFAKRVEITCYFWRLRREKIAQIKKRKFLVSGWKISQAKQRFQRVTSYSQTLRLFSLVHHVHFWNLRCRGIPTRVLFANGLRYRNKRIYRYNIENLLQSPTCVGISIRKATNNCLLFNISGGLPMLKHD